MSEILTLDGEIEGKISLISSISGEIGKTLTVSGGITAGTFVPAIPVYEGVYQVSPLASLDIVLETSGKRLQDNIIVNQIPYYQATNDSGGYTVTIG